MAEKRKLSTAGSGAKRIKALFSSFIRKDPSEQTKDTSTATTTSLVEVSDPQATAQDIKDQKPDDTTDGTAPGTGSNSETPTRRSFRPLNSEDFFGRVETFTAFGWFAKPSDLSPLHCARYGWENIDTDCLKCVSCREILCGELPALWEKESYSQSYNNLKDSIRTAHSKICPWSDSPSPESFLHISLGDIKSCIADFYVRVDSMYPLGDSLPSIDYSPVKEEDGFCIDKLKPVLTNAVTERGEAAIIASGDDHATWLAACVLAIFGWQKSHSEQTGCPVLVCQYCRRHAGLWNFSCLREVNAEETVVPDQSSRTDAEADTQSKRIKDIEKTTFNPSTEHRSWCPWIQSSPQSPVKVQRISDESLDDTGEKPATELSWQQLMVALLKTADPATYGTLDPVINRKTTPPNQTWKAVRRILNIWQSKQTTDPTEQKKDPPNATESS